MSSIECKIENCTAHKLEILAVDLKAHKEKNNKFLCVKCLIERIDGNYIVLINEGLEMIKEMKNQCKKQTIENTQHTLSHIQALQSSVLEINKLFSNVFGKLQNSFDENINSNQQDIQSKEQMAVEFNLDSDFDTLSDNYKGNSQYETPKQQVDIECFKSLMDNIQSQLSWMANAEQFSQIFESIKQMKSQYQIEQQIPKKDIDKRKTHSLSQTCNQNDHGLEIIMIYLNQNESDQSGLACSRCIQQFPRREYITLEDANIKWKEYKRQQNQMITKYNENRFGKFNSAIKTIQQLKEIYNQTLSDIILQLERKRVLSKDMQQTNTIDEIYELDDKDIMKVVDILSQKDKHQKLKKEQEEQDQFDSIFYQNLKQNLENLLQYDLLTKHNLLRIQNQHYLNQEKELNIIEEKQNFLTSDINFFIKKIELQNEYVTILDDAFNFYKMLQQEVDNLQQQGQLSQLLNSEQETQSQIIQKKYEIYQQNSQKMKSMIMAEDNLNQLSKLSDELNQNKQLQSTLSSQLDESKKQIETLNAQIEQLNLDITKNQQELINKEEASSEIATLKSQIEQLNLDITKSQEDKSKLDAVNSEIQTLNTQNQQLQQQIISIQKDSQGQLQAKVQEVNTANQQYNQLQQEHNQFKQDLIEKSKLLTQQYYAQVYTYIEQKTTLKIRLSMLIYQATRDGMNHQSCWSKINGKSNLLFVFKSKSGNIFGAFSPCQWLQSVNDYVQDDKLSSFLFTQTHNQFYPLKEPNKADAIYSYASYGPTFGSNHDLYIGNDFQSGSSTIGGSYQIDQYQIADATIHLYGQATPNIEECEIFELILK